MPDREKVKKGFERCLSGKMPFGCGECPYFGDEEYTDAWSCRLSLMRDAFAMLKEDCHNCKLECLLQKYDELKEKYDALLKEQESVSVHDPGAYCPKCGWMLYPEDHPHHCGNCGQAVKWE